MIPGCGCFEVGLLSLYWVRIDCNLKPRGSDHTASSHDQPFCGLLFVCIATNGVKDITVYLQWHSWRPGLSQKFYWSTRNFLHFFVTFGWWVVCFARCKQCLLWVISDLISISTWQASDRRVIKLDFPPGTMDTFTNSEPPPCLVPKRNGNNCSLSWPMKVMEKLTFWHHLRFFSLSCCSTVYQ